MATTQYSKCSNVAINYESFEDQYGSFCLNGFILCCNEWLGNLGFGFVLLMNT